MAKRILLSSAEGGFPKVRRETFDYLLPRTWGINYQQASVYNIRSQIRTTETAAEVAAAAMTLFQTLELKPENTYQDLFYEVTEGPIIQALARVHAATGDVEEAISWAKKIGSDEKIALSEDDYTEIRAVRQRVHSLLGVAEGILDRTNSWPQPPFDD